MAEALEYQESRGRQVLKELEKRQKILKAIQGPASSRQVLWNLAYPVMSVVLFMVLQLLPWHSWFHTDAAGLNNFAAGVVTVLLLLLGDHIRDGLRLNALIELHRRNGDLERFISGSSGTES
jgi:hypothetical protein